VARGIITERLKEVEKLSEGLYQPLNIEPLHKLRIAAKRLRYALELFEPCWGPGISTFAKKVASLQSSLGELHDFDIWIETLGEHLSGVERQSKDRAAGALWLLSHCVRLHAKHLRDSLGKWRDWEVNDLGLRLRDCLQQDTAVLNKPVLVVVKEVSDITVAGSA
jgi:CHAD domain-containing protein